ncbi:MAG: hypothetical protein LBH59_03085 [Planctomycetaceae bacterium]|nr:hypothetical protein [Planctomycetaceae bacterium]
MKNNNLLKRINKFSLVIFVSIISFCLVTTVSAQSNKNKSVRQPVSTFSKTTQPSRTFSSQPKSNLPRVSNPRIVPANPRVVPVNPRIVPASPRVVPVNKPSIQQTPRSRPTPTPSPSFNQTPRPNRRPTPTTTPNPARATESRSTTAEKPQPPKRNTSRPDTRQSKPRESVIVLDKKSVEGMPKNVDKKLPTFRRSNQSINSSGKVTTNKTLPQVPNPDKTTTPTLTPKIATTPEKENTTSTTTPTPPTQTPTTKATVDNKRDRVSDVFRRRPSSDVVNSRSGNHANNRNDKDRPNSLSLDRARNAKRFPDRNSEIAREIIKSNLRNSPSSYRHQPPPKIIKDVRKNFRGYNDYWTGDWYRRHPKSWHPVTIHVRHWWYRPHWRDMYNWFDSAFFAGVVYDRMLHSYHYYPYYYGNNIIYNGNMVYVNGVPYVSSAEYYRQALELARTADALVQAEAEQAQKIIVVNQPIQEEPQPTPIPTPSPTPASAEQKVDEGWLPMGTFAFLAIESEKVADNNETVTNLPEETHEILQLATNKIGQIRGNFVDEKNNTIRQMIGAIDPKTQRVALRFVDDDKTVWECGLWNLTQDTVPVLIHSGETQFEQKTLIRLVNDDESDIDVGENETELAP